MRQMWLWLCLFIASSPLSAEIKDEFASLETDLDFIIDGKVNVISGQFIDMTTDLEVPSIFPLSVTRVTIPFTYESGNFWEGWHINYEGNCKSIYNKELDYQAQIRDENGTPLYFKVPYKNKDKFAPIGNWFAKGETNLGRLSMGGKGCIRNYQARIEKDLKFVALKTGGGVVKTFKRDGYGWPYTYHSLDQLTTPSGFSMELANTSETHAIKRTFSAQKQEMGRIEMDHGATHENFRLNPKIFLYANDGRHIEYHFKIHYNTPYDKPKKCYGMLEQVKLADNYSIIYCYDEHTQNHGERCIRKWEPLGRYLAIEYYTPGESNVLWSTTPNKLTEWSEKVHKMDSYSPLCNRVRRLLQPADNNREVETKRFIYHFVQDKKGEFTKGQTDVYDCYHNLSTYGYNSYFRPIEIVHYIGEPKQYTPDIKQQLYWGDPKKTQEGFLAARHIAACNGSEYKARTYEYDAKGNVSKETFFGDITGTCSIPLLLDALGQPRNRPESYTKRFDYDFELCNLIGENHSNGLQVRYAYDEHADRLRHKKVSGADLTKHTYYNYHPCGAVEEIREVDGPTQRIERHTPKLSMPCYGFPEKSAELYLDQGKEISLKTTHFTYHHLGKPEEIKVLDAEGALAYVEQYEHFDPMGNCQKETLRTGEVINRTFDPYSHLIQEIGPNGLYVKHYTYDSVNRLTHETVRLAEGASYTTEYQYDAIGRLTCTVDPYGNRTDFVNDRYGRPIKILYPEVDGRRPFELKDYDIFGNVTLFQDKLGHITKTSYNAYDQPTQVIHPDGSVENFVYNRDGTLSFLVDKAGVRTEYTTDCHGRLHQKKILYPEREAVESYTYDGTLLKSATDLNGAVTRYGYDGAGRKNSETTEGSLTTFEYDTLGRLSRTTRYDQGRPVSVSVDTYDVYDRLAEHWIEDSQGNRFLYEKYGYDPLGNLTMETKGGHTTIYEYDGLNRAVKKIDPEGNTTTWAYRVHPHQEIRTDPDGTRHIETFDALQRVVLKEIYDGEMLLSSTRYAYDANDNLLEERHKVIGRKEQPFKLQRAYDSMNRLVLLKEPLGKTTQFEYTVLGELKCVTQPNGIKLIYSYDGRNHLKRLQSSDGTVDYAFQYDVMGRLLSVADKQTKVTRTYTPRGKLATDTSSFGTVSYTYNDLDQMTEVTFPDGSIVEYEYNALGMVKVKRNRFEHQYLAYDSFGHPSLERLIDGTIRSRECDALGRLKKIVHPDYSLEPLQYDSMGNLIQAGLNSYTYDKLNQLAAEAGFFNRQYGFDSLHNPLFHPINMLHQITADHTYDLNGNLKEDLGGIYTYDALNRLTSVQVDGQTYTYVYDGLNRRLMKEGPDGKESYWYLEDREVASLKEDALSSFRVLGEGLGAEIGAAVLIEIEGSAYAPHCDQSGNLTKLGDARCTYSAFGEVFGTRLSPWGFASKRTDPETGWSYFGRRYYAPTLGRWITCDPLGFDVGINLYAYVQNNPLTHFDAYGLLILPAFNYSSLSMAQGILHGMVDFGMNTVQSFQSGFYDIGHTLQDFEPHERVALRSDFHQTQYDQFSKVESWVQNSLGIDPSDSVYQSFRYGTSMGLELASLATGVYGAAKGAMSLYRTLKIPSISNLNNLKTLRHSNELISYNFNYVSGQHMLEKGRRIPLHILDKIIKFPMAVKEDPQLVLNAQMYYSQMWRNGKLYNVEVLYDQSINKIMHFKYSKDPMGPLEGVK